MKKKTIKEVVDEILTEYKDTIITEQVSGNNVVGNIQFNIKDGKIKSTEFKFCGYTIDH